MPKLSAAPTLTVKLPVTTITVVVRSVTLDEAMTFSERFNSADDAPAGEAVKQMKTTLAEFITSWDAQNEDGSPADITEDNIGKLPVKDVNHLAGKVMEFLGGVLDEDAKKDKASASKL